jgi:hypothetical protein
MATDCDRLQRDARCLSAAKRSIPPATLVSHSDHLRGLQSARRTGHTDADPERARLLRGQHTRLERRPTLRATCNGQRVRAKRLLMAPQHRRTMTKRLGLAARHVRVSGGKCQLDCRTGEQCSTRKQHFQVRRTGHARRRTRDAERKSRDAIRRKRNLVIADTAGPGAGAAASETGLSVRRQRS